MPVVLTDVQIAFAAGALFADAGAPVIEAARKHSEASLLKVYCRYMWRSLVYATFFLGPGATILLLAYPAWETQYISAVFDNMTGHPVNAAYYGLFLMGLFAGGWFGNWLGFKWVLAGKRKQLRIFYTVLVAISFGIFWARYPAPARIGTYAEFKRDPNALPYFTEDKTFFYCFLVLVVLTGLPLVIGFIKARMEVKQVKAGSIEPLIASPLPWPRTNT